ncbi:substrate-binding domain-containing protein [soil metagenome]
MPGDTDAPREASQSKPTIRDVAELAGVHPSTVSRVLNGDDSRAIAPTREKIRNAAATLGWRPNSIARSLSLGRSYAIGMSIPLFSYPPHASMIFGAERAAEDRGNILVVTDSSDSEERLQSQLLRMSDRVDGFIVASVSISSPTVSVLEQARIPFVLLNRRAAGSHRSVIGNDEYGVRLAAEHLRSLGHRSVAYFGVNDEIDTAQRRHAAFHSMCIELGMTLDDGNVMRMATAQEDVEPRLALMLFGEPSAAPTAIFADNLFTAANVLTAVKKLGLRVPEDVSVIGFDNAPIAAHLWVPLTAVQMPNEELGATAVESLLHLLAGGEGEMELVVPTLPSLVLRESTSPPRA